MTGRRWPASSGDVATGVQRLVQWSQDRQIVWNCLECTHIDNPARKPTPREVRAEAWMSLIHGSRGLVFFVHQFKPSFREAALLDDAEMLEAVTALNRQITRLAPVLNSPTIADAAKVESEDPAVPVAMLAKRHEGATYLFTVALREGATRATFALKGPKGDRSVEVIGEQRALTARSGSFEDRFAAWDAHIYRIAD